MEPQVTFKEQGPAVEIKRPTRKPPLRKPAIKTDSNKIETLEVDKNSIEYKKARDAEMVRGKFMNLEQPGAPLDFVYKAYKGDPVTTYNMKHGEIKDIPFGVATFLNEECATVIYEHYKGEKKMIGGYNPDENNAFRVATKVNRFSFQPLNFSDRDFVGLNSNKVIKVEKI